MSRSQRASRVRRVFAVLIVVLAGMLLSGCDRDGDEVTEEPTPDEAVQIEAGGDYDVRRWDGHDNAWATLSDATHFDQLTDDDTWENLVAEGLVTTDSSGEAEMCEADEIVAGTNECNPDACHIFVYGGSDFGHHWCPTSGYTDCTGGATLSFEDCDVTVATLTADVTGLGTWFSVTYLWDTQVTLVIAGDGKVEVTPIRTLMFEGEVPPLSGLPPKERAKAWAEAQVVERRPGNAVSVRVEAGTDPARYLYTAPDKMLEELGLSQTVPDRQWLGMETLPDLRGHLKELEPRLEPWLERVWAQADGDGIRVGPWLPVPDKPIQPDEADVFLGSQGGPLQDSYVQKTLLTAVDKEKVTELAFADQEVALSTRLGNSEVDARLVEYDPEAAKEMLAETGYPDGFDLQLIYPEGDAQLESLAGAIAEDLAGVGIGVEMVPMPEPDLTETVEKLAAEGESVVWVERR